MRSSITFLKPLSGTFMCVRKLFFIAHRNLINFPQSVECYYGRKNGIHVHLPGRDSLKSHISFKFAMKLLAVTPIMVELDKGFRGA